MRSYYSIYLNPYILKVAFSVVNGSIYNSIINMMKPRCTETQMVGIFKEAEGGIAMANILRTHRISGATF